MAHTLTADFEFLMASPEEFFQQGRLSMTRLYRTLIALNADCTRQEWLDWAQANGINQDTAAKQFRLSRRITAECGETIRADGSVQP